MPNETYREIIRYLSSRRAVYRLHNEDALLDLESGGTAILGLAKDRESNAVAIAGALRPQQPGYWDFAEKLFLACPTNANLRNALARTLDPLSGWGHYWQRLGESADVIDKRLQEAGMASEFRLWLEQIRAYFRERQRVEQEREND